MGQWSVKVSNDTGKRFIPTTDKVTGKAKTIPVPYDKTTIALTHKTTGKVVVLFYRLHAGRYGWSSPKGPVFLDDVQQTLTRLLGNPDKVKTTIDRATKHGSHYRNVTT
jgi:hypothetical protein